MRWRVSETIHFFAFLRLEDPAGPRMQGDTMGGARVTVREGNELRVQRQGLVRGVPCSAAEVHGE